MRKNFYFFLGVIACSFSVSLMANPFAGGSGTSSDPYQVSTPDQLDSVRNYLANSFELINSINLNVAPYNKDEGWEPIGKKGNPFTGTFNGNNYAIKNLFIETDSTDWLGLFGKDSTAVIKNIGIINCDITASHNSQDKGGNSVGALTGSTYYSSFTNCHSTGTIVGYRYCGGLLGNVDSTTVEYCYSTVDVTAHFRYAGGLAGLCTYTSFNYCYATGNISGYEDIGGLFGRLQYSSAIAKNCYATGTVQGVTNAGGIVGRMNADPTINYCYSLCSVTGGSYLGAIVGDNSGTVSNCFYNKDIQKTNNGYGSSKTTAEMKKSSTYSGWDFTSDWTIREDSTYPALPEINNAPFATKETTTGSITALLANDYDYESLQANFVIAFDSLYSLIDSVEYVDSIADIKNDDSLKVYYRIGEYREEYGDILWGNKAHSILKVSNNNVTFNSADYTTDEDVAITIELDPLSNDTDGDVLTYSIAKSASNGTSKISNNELVYTPASGFFGEDAVTVRVSDGLTYATAVINISVTEYISAVNQTNSNTILLYPNPTNGILYIDANNSDIQKISVCDITGKTVLETTSLLSDNSIDLSNLSGSLFIIMVQTNNETVVSKIIKQ